MRRGLQLKHRGPLRPGKEVTGGPDSLGMHKIRSADPQQWWHMLMQNCRYRLQGPHGSRLRTGVPAEEAEPSRPPMHYSHHTR